MNTLFLVSSLGTISSVGNCITPSLAVYSKSKSRSLHEIPFTFLIVNHVCQLTWLFYSIMLLSTELFIVNILTAILSLVTLSIYYFYSEKLSTFIPAYVSSVLLFTLFIFVVFDTESLGLVCLISSIGTTTASTEALKNTIAYKNPNYIDLGMTLSGAFSSATWTLFGVMTLNRNVTASSGYGLIISVLMVIAYYYYGKPKRID